MPKTSRLLTEKDLMKIVADLCHFTMHDVISLAPSDAWVQRVVRTGIQRPMWDLGPNLQNGTLKSCAPLPRHLQVLNLHLSF